MLYATGVVLWQALRLAFGDRWWWLALANTFSLYLFLPLALLVPLGLLSRRRSALLVLGVPLAVFLALYGELFLPHATPAKAEGATALRIMTLNVLTLNKEGATIEALVRDTAPDIVCLQELTPAMAGDLVMRLGSDYPHYELLPERDTSGVGVFSRYPLVDAGELSDPAQEEGRWRHGAQVMTVDVDGQNVHLLNIHALPHYLTFANPQWATYFEMGFRLRERQLQRWMDWIAGQDMPLIAVGDFNLTDSSAGYRIVAEHLADAHRQAGWGWGHTWPARSNRFLGMPFFSRLLRLDYVWHSTHWQVLDVRVAEWDRQSDHLPVVATLMLRTGWERVP